MPSDTKSNILPKNNFTRTFSTNCQKNSVPKELLSLISSFIGRTDHTSNLNQVTLTCAQLIVSNYKPNNTGTEDKMRCHSQKRQTLVFLYNALNLYGRLRSKCIITNHFHMGLSVTYLRILKITKQTADAMLEQFKDLKCFLPRATQKGLFTKIVKDNIEINLRLSTSTMDYHGTGFSLIQMHSEESEVTVYDFLYTMDNAIDSLKIDYFPEKYSQISTFLSDFEVYNTPKCDDSIEIPSFGSSILNQAVQQEVECNWKLDATVALNHGWTSDHVSQKRYKKRRKEFTAVLPLLREKLHTLSMQYHCMNIVTNTINKINPRQTPVDVCDQPIFALTKQIKCG